MSAVCKVWRVSAQIVSEDGDTGCKLDLYLKPQELQPCSTNCPRFCCSSQNICLHQAQENRCNQVELNQFHSGVKREKNNLSKLPGRSRRKKNHILLFLCVQLLLWSCSTGTSWRTRLASLRTFTCSQVQINLPRSTINLIRVVFRSTHL